MWDKITEFLNSDVSGLSSGTIFFAFIVAAIAIVAFIFLVKTCLKIEKISGRKAFSLVKIIMVALFPTVFNLAALVRWEIPLSVIGVLTVILCAAVFAWNLLTYGLVCGLMFTIMHIVTGFALSLGIAALVFGVAAIAIMSPLAKEAVKVPSPEASGETPDGVCDVNTGENFDIMVGANGSLFLNSGGRDSVLYPGESLNSYYDSDGNRYTAFYD